MNLVKALQAECNRVRDVMRQSEAMPDRAIALLVMRDLVDRSERAIAEHDKVACIQCPKELREFRP